VKNRSDTDTEAQREMKMKERNPAY